ncbi:acylneuraminate cytidylyltransferase family protein [Acetobacterium wieringae]|uniref:Acylneuraminate cytidylyltransferase family protein n=1 Tax=Acetobacterium wieringae TaxID=52694 RepID=A0A5D0WPD2_9FIRM|nr:acylneuraminate cytidylyltransferase family protein [Acetobacterium wieringae]
MKKIAIIPARSGSKGLKDKNVKLLNGKPLIAYTIEAAINSHCFDKMVVSTDSEAYAEIAKEYGAEVPFLRSEHLSGDEVATNDVIVDLLIKLKELGEEFDYLMILQPTSPLRTSDDIKKAIELMAEKNANAVVSLCEVDHSPLYTGQVPENLRIDGFIKKNISYRRQELPKYYRLNGAIYLSKVDYFLKYQDLYQEDCFAYIMDKSRSIDIDDEFDFELAEFYILHELENTMMNEEIYYTDGIIKSIDLKNSEVVICSNNSISISKDSKIRYNLWLEKDGDVLLEEAKVIECNKKISYKNVDNEIKSALIQIALGKQKARFMIKKNSNSTIDKNKELFVLDNLVISNE